MATCGTLEVVSAFDPGAVQVTSCPNPGSFNPGETATLNITVENNNPNAASVTIRVTADGTVIGSRSVNISAESSRTYGVEITAPSTAGTTYSVDASVVNVSQMTATAQSLPSLPSADRLMDRGTAATVGVGVLGAGAAAYGMR